MKNTNTGSRASTVMVMKLGQSVENWPTALYTCSTIVRSSELERNTFAFMKSFHVPIVWNTTTVVRIGRISGITIDQKMRSGPAPSMRAASISSNGRLRMYPTIRK